MSRILIVDDEAIIMMQLEERLSAMGYTVAGMAANGEDAIEKAKRSEPDLVLMDIVMPGRLNGIDAARIIYDELDVPVVFVTSYADDAIIEKARSVRPYGYIVKPFNEREIKAAIEVALFRKAVERQETKLKRAGSSPRRAGQEEGEPEPDQPVYFDLPELKTVLLKDIFTDIVLFLYTDEENKESIFKFALEEGLKNEGYNLFAYSRSTVQKHFLKEIQNEKIYVHRIKNNDVTSLMPGLEKCTGLPRNGETDLPVHIFLDFSDTGAYDDLITVKDFILEKKNAGFRISGLIAHNLGKIDHMLIQSLAEGIPRIIVSTGKDTMLSFAHTPFPAESVSIVPQETIDDVVKKSLEPVVLSLLDKPISGYDIVHEIHNRYRVLIPQARIYTLLYELEENGYLEVKKSGKSKLYCPTEEGRKYITGKLNNFKMVFQHILGGDARQGTGNPDKKTRV